jgi:hypothetical protein
MTCLAANATHFCTDSHPCMGIVLSKQHIAPLRPKTPHTDAALTGQVSQKSSSKLIGQQPSAAARGVIVVDLTELVE